MNELGQKIFDYRVENKLTQEEFAEKVGVTLQTISNIENGYQNASKFTRARIERVLQDKE